MDMNKEVLDRLDHLGGKLEQASEHGYESLIKYTVVEGIIGLSLIVLVLAVTIALWVILYKSYKSCNKDNNTLLFEYIYYKVECTVAGFLCIMFGVCLTCIVFIVLPIGLPICIQEIVNPEGYLIKSTIDSLG
ncbi:membrane protein [Staphylococcus phage CF5]|uniref:Membrane protein n=1 Tax=Staphylococcus phage CF5 TaxID=3113739 RepID=A0AAX4J736_9CAUD|nr:membrane protein [Staphylococcus phage CF5]